MGLVSMLEKVLGPTTEHRRQMELQPQASALARLLAAQGLTGPEGAIAVRQMMNPQSRAAGIEMSQGLLNRQSQQNDPMYQAQLQAQVLGNTLQAQRVSNFPIEQQYAANQEQRAATAEGRASQIFPLQLRGAQAGLQGQMLQNRQARAAIAAAGSPPSPGQLDRQIWEAEAGAPLPRGFRPVRRFAEGPDGQVVQWVDVQPVEQTDAYNKAENEIRLRESFVTQIDDFLDLLAEIGTEYRGGQALKLRESRRRILGDYAELLRLGVLQPAEMQNLEAILPDPTSFGSQLNPWAAENIGSVYDQLRNFQVERLKDARQRNWFIPAKPVLPEDAHGR